MNTDTALAQLDAYLSAHDYRTATLLYCNTLLLSAGIPFPPKAAAVRDWFNPLFFAAALSPDTMTLTPPPYAFAEVAAEVASVLSPAS